MRQVRIEHKEHRATHTLYKNVEFWYYLRRLLRLPLPPAPFATGEGGTSGKATRASLIILAKTWSGVSISHLGLALVGGGFVSLM